MWVLPVNDNNLILLSAAIALPMSAPPQHKVATPPGRPLFFSTSATILVVATATKGVVSAPFHKTVSPQT